MNMASARESEAQNPNNDEIIKDNEMVEKIINDKNDDITEPNEPPPEEIPEQIRIIDIKKENNYSTINIKDDQELREEFDQFPKVIEEQAEIESQVESQPKPKLVDKSNEIRIPKQGRSRSVKDGESKPSTVSK